MDYSKTLHLPETDFPMRGNLPKKEPGFVEFWKEHDLYHARLEKRRKDGAPTFVLHDGPPYANGKIHIGHALNKTLKDIIVRYKHMAGYEANYIPGWDTHGLPIEYAVLKDSGEDRANMTPLELRRKCLAYAKKWIEIQKADFIRMGVVGDFAHPYVTFDPHLEAKELEVFGEMANKGYIYKGKKAVYWCPHCETALAEAEIEYKDRKSPSIYVKFPAVDLKGLAPEGVPKDKLFAVIWTTTPWTIPANEAICVNPKFTYVWVHNKAADEYYLMNKELAPKALEECKVEDYEFVGREMTGAEWELATFHHPLLDRLAYVLEGNHVTLDAGTGCVHTAPGHGVDDFEVCQDYRNKGKLDLPIICPVDEKGHMTAEAGLGLEGKTIWEAEGPVISALAHAGMLLGKKSIHHQYAHCWRCKNPIIYRATEQWFASINDFRDKALKAVDDTRFIPSWGHDRLYNMIRDRQDWCISRQRSWGVPIPAFYCDDCGKWVITPETMKKVEEIVEKEGTDAWWAHSAEELLPEGFKCPHCGGTHFHKEKDIMDVWFDSGSTWNGVLRYPHKEWEGVKYPCDLYLEGSDQHRGWFQSSLLTSIGAYGVPPYKSVMHCGFTVDEEGRKMSKSLGNGIDPEEMCNKFGADVLRLWVSSCDYSQDVSISENILKQVSDAYRRFRNTFRFLLGNLNDFTPDDFVEDWDALEPLDQWALVRLSQLLADVEAAYESYRFNSVYRALYDYVNDISAVYMDVTKDRLYAEAPASPRRRAVQTVLLNILEVLVRVMAPILSFTTDEVWECYPPAFRAIEGREASVQLAGWPCARDFVPSLPADAGAQVATMEEMMAVREVVTKALEEARNEKIIGKSQEASLTVTAPAALVATAGSFDSAVFEELFIVAKVQFVEGDGDEITAAVTVAEGEKCPRCWNIRELGGNPNHPDVCERCGDALDAIQGGAE